MNYEIIMEMKNNQEYLGKIVKNIATNIKEYLALEELPRINDLKLRSVAYHPSFSEKDERVNNFLTSMFNDFCHVEYENFVELLKEEFPNVYLEHLQGSSSAFSYEHRYLEDDTWSTYAVSNSTVREILIDVLAEYHSSEGHFAFDTFVDFLHYLLGEYEEEDIQGMYYLHHLTTALTDYEQSVLEELNIRKELLKLHHLIEDYKANKALPAFACFVAEYIEEVKAPECSDALEKGEECDCTLFEEDDSCIFQKYKTFKIYQLHKRYTEEGVYEKIGFI